MSTVDKRYLELLDRALKMLPPRTSSGRRLEDIQLKVIVAGKRTVIQNFRELCSILNREPSHVARFLLRELAAPGHIEGDALVIQGEFPRQRLIDILTRYIKNYVICPVCQAPDTILVKEKRMVFMVCTACGAKSSVKPMA